MNTRQQHSTAAPSASSGAPASNPQPHRSTPKRRVHRPRPVLQGELCPADLLRVADVLQYVPVGESTWWRLVKSGEAPAGKLIGKRTRVWTGQEILDFIASLGRG